MDTQIYGFYANVKMLEPDDVFRHFFCSLSHGRRQKIEQIRPAKEKARSLMAGVLLDYGLWQLYGLRERDVAVSYGAQGKPYARDYPGIHFNLSHSGDYALAAFAGTEVGCDIQKKGETKRDVQIAGRFFSEGERQAVAAGMDFYRIWARKESYLKLTGAGMALDMRSFDVTGGEGPCYFADFALAGYCLSICYAGAELPVVWREVRPEEFWNVGSAVDIPRTESHGGE